MSSPDPTHSISIGADSSGAAPAPPGSDATAAGRWELLWIEGDWPALLRLEGTPAEDPSIQDMVLLFLAVAHLQVGKLGKAKFLIQKAINKGCNKDTVKNALLAASIEKLGDAASLQHADALIGSAERARALRHSVLNAITQARALSKPVPAPAAAVSLLGSETGLPASLEVRSPAPPEDRRTASESTKIGILSGYYPGLRFNSQVNHRLYASRHGYRYIFDSTPRFDPRTYMRKLEAVLEYLDMFDWLFWIDDDAYFTDFEIPLETFIKSNLEAEFIVCKSPSTKELFTRISSGQFLLKNTPRAKQFIADALATDLKQVQKWWHKSLGMFTKGDQDALVYLTETMDQYRQPFMKILEHNNFNNRDFEYEKSVEEHFLVHFTGSNKIRDQAAFCTRLSCSQYICPPGEIDKLVLR